MFKPALSQDMTRPIHCDNMVNQIRIEVRLPEGHWSGDVSRSRPEAVLRIEETMPLGKGRGTARLSTSSNLIDELDSHPGLDEVRDLGGNRFEVDIAPGGGGFIKPLREVGVIPQSPFEVRDGWVDWTIECSAEKSRELVQLLREGDIPYRVVSTKSSGTRMLTPRQRIIFDTAINEGYWDAPRRITLSALAEILDISKSTLSVHLHKIEGTIINTFSDDVRKNS